MKLKNFSKLSIVFLFLVSSIGFIFQNCSPTPFQSNPNHSIQSASTQANASPENLNGICGLAHGRYLADEIKFHGELCRSGVASPVNPRFPIPGEIVSYYCVGPKETVSCYIQREQITSIPVNGECGAAQGQYEYDETQFRSSQFCQTGDLQLAPQFPANGTENSYTCLGLHGGTSKTCTVRRNLAPVGAPIDGECGNAAGSYLMNESSFRTPLCAAGLASPTVVPFPVPGSSVLYMCSGINNGVSTNCTASRSNNCASPNYLIIDSLNNLRCGQCSTVQFYQADTKMCVNRSFAVLTEAAKTAATNLNFTQLSSNSEGWEFFVTVSGTTSGANDRTLHRISAIEGDEFELLSISYFDPINLIVYDVNGVAISANEENDDPPDQTLTDGGRYGFDKTPIWRAPYSGTFYVNSGWQQGSRFNYFELTIRGRKK